MCGCRPELKAAATPAFFVSDRVGRQAPRTKQPRRRSVRPVIATTEDKGGRSFRMASNTGRSAWRKRGKTTNGAGPQPPMINWPKIEQFVGLDELAAVALRQ